MEFGEGAAPPPQHIKHSNYTYLMFIYTVQLSFDVYLWKTIAPSHLEVRRFQFCRRNARLRTSPRLARTLSYGGPELLRAVTVENA